jgi:hypothetical protein
MDAETRKHFVEHVRELERRSIAGDDFSTKSLACMALLKEGFPWPDDPDGGEVIDFAPYLRLVA